jgi:hypothetical protein
MSQISKAARGLKKLLRKGEEGARRKIERVVVNAALERVAKSAQRFLMGGQAPPEFVRQAADHTALKWQKQLPLIMRALDRLAKEAAEAEKAAPPGG